MTRRAGRWLVLAAAVAVIAAGVPSLFRPGYSPDEEFTLFAVRGIRAGGLPILPSGLLYDRGLLYSYASWLAWAVTGLELPAFRAISLLCSAAALGLGYALVRRVASPAAGVAATLLVAGSLPFWAAATTGRFYAPFVLTCVAVLTLVAAVASPGATPTTARWIALAALALVSRLTHELAFTMMAIPAAILAIGLTNHQSAKSAQSAAALSVKSATSLAIGLVAAQAVLTGLHLLAPGTGGGVMIQRFFLWQVLNLFERPAGAPLGVVLAAVVVAWLIVPARAVRSVVTGLGAAALIAGVSTAMSSTALAGALAYPLDMFWHLAGEYPVTTWMALALLVARLCGAGGEWPPGERAAHLGWVGWTLWFGVIESGITLNYVLLPIVCMLAAIGMDLVAIGQHTRAVWPGRRSQLLRAALTGAALLIVADQWPGAGTVPERLAAARPTIDVLGIDAFRSGLQPEDRVACTDELACLLLVGRADAWLALDDYVRERFVVERDSGPVGVYTGAPAVFGLDDLMEPRGSQVPGRRFIVDVFKPYPVGHSRTWLPRALEASRIDARTLIATPQARVVEIVMND